MPALLRGARLCLALLLPACGPDPDVASIRETPGYQAAALLEKGWRQPVALTYRPGFISQENGAFCGPTSVANLVRSLGTPAVTPEGVLEGTGESWWTVRFDGITLDELAEVVRKRTSRRVTVLRDLTLETFLAHMALANDPSRRYLINFSREPLFGEGGGHHSPIGAWLPEERLVMVLDVNADYRPWLVTPEALFQAMDTVDSSTGKKRGLLLIE